MQTDLLIHDGTVIDGTASPEPNQTAIGMHHVIVNGKVALKDGELTGERGGQVLRRG